MKFLPGGWDGKRLRGVGEVGGIIPGFGVEPCLRLREKEHMTD